MDSRPDHPYDYVTPEYETYTKTHIAYLNGDATKQDDDHAFAAAQRAAQAPRRITLEPATDDEGNLTLPFLSALRGE